MASKVSTLVFASNWQLYLQIAAKLNLSYSLAVTLPGNGGKYEDDKLLGDLSHYGIVPLTGEACGLMYRILFDVTARGKKILEKAFDVSELRLRENWNRGTDDDPHVGSHHAGS